MECGGEFQCGLQGGSGTVMFHSSGKSMERMSSRESDAKKLRSRHAAQSRRIFENNEFDSLARVLPVPRAISNNLLDKASVVRLATTFLKLHHFCTQGQPPWIDFGHNCSHWPDFECHLGTRILEALDGFVLCLAEDGTILYVSETVSVGLGLSQIEMIGNRVFDYIHNDDMDSWYPIGSRYHHQPIDENTKIICRFKSSLVKRATKDTQESSLGFKVVEFHLAPRFQSADTIDNRSPSVGIGYTGYALPLLCPSLPECRMDRHAFVITTLLDLRIHYVDSVAEEILLGTKSSPVRGASVYSFVHTADLNIVGNLHREVLKLGSSTSGFFRLMAAKGGCMWTQASAVRVNRVRARQAQCTIITMLCSGIGLDNFEDPGVLAPHQYAIGQDHGNWPQTTYEDACGDATGYAA